MAQTEKEQQTTARLAEAFGVYIASDLMNGAGITADVLNVAEFTANFQKAMKGEEPFQMQTVGPKIQQYMGGCAAAKQSGNPMPQAPENFSAEFGFMVGFNVKSQGMLNANNFDFAGFDKGFASVFEGAPSMTGENAQRIVNTTYQKMLAEMAQKAKEQEKAFFEKNAKKNEKIISLPSGIQYEVLKEGKGPKPTITDKVRTHYHGTLLDGSVFDSSVDRGEPAEFPIQGVIKGWQEVVPMMGTGAKWRVYIPSALAYGAQKRKKIPANSILIFEIELLDIVK
ncbi:FKBP-type peptidyl-prolyl cis-trans isomerase [Saprospira sp. CCB-QB6]|uniref:FKBP-type peptidyl-prolyl cis-trans isomerase n=1 Tax=Saprospira sp. CCB-QB6 TaxID=3023936 RepID=UPI002348FE84|nr:FKBP-type peptidyl-prolyl cis-trans isomerase [Saprospira sp. CCB-QB6]WCL82025.1 FKBP-type peptidyl-prolyl cis-trans isomerase [Saprospira sp. CCB-QB6]